MHAYSTKKCDIVGICNCDCVIKKKNRGKTEVIVI